MGQHNNNVRNDETTLSRAVRVRDHHGLINNTQYDRQTRYDFAEQHHKLSKSQNHDRVVRSCCRFSRRNKPKLRDAKRCGVVHNSRRVDAYRPTGACTNELYATSVRIMCIVDRLSGSLEVFFFRYVQVRAYALGCAPWATRTATLNLVVFSKPIAPICAIRRYK